MPDVAAAEQLAAAVLDYGENGSPRQAAERLDAHGRRPRRARCPRRPPRPSTRAPSTRCGPAIPSATPRPSTSSSGRTWPSATSSARPTCSPGWARTSLARAWTPTRVTARRSGSGLVWFTPTERLLAALPPPDRADVVVVLDAGRRRHRPRAARRRRPADAGRGRPGARSGGHDPARPAVPGGRAGHPRPVARDPGSGRPAHRRRGPCPCRAARWSRPGPDRRASRSRTSGAHLTSSRDAEPYGRHPVSRFGHVEPADLPDDLRERIEAIAEKSGFVPNVFRALARRPAELRAFLDYHDALMEREGGLSKAERELVVVATSGANHCVYCVVAHGAILRIRAKDTEIADRVATNPWTAPLPAARAGHRRPRPGPRHRAGPARRRAPRRRARRRARRRRDLGRRRDHGAVRALQPDGTPDRAAAQPGVLPDGPGAPHLTRSPRWRPQSLDRRRGLPR